MKRPLAFWLDLAVKSALVGLLAFGAFSGLERFDGKAFGWRLAGYTVAAFLVPAIWALRGRRPPFPYLVDILFTLPFLIDTAGNALDLYDSIDWWDDANHFVNWGLLGGAFAAALARTSVRGRRLEWFALVVGFGGVTAILWEIGEYFAFIRDSPELASAYTTRSVTCRSGSAARRSRRRSPSSWARTEMPLVGSAPLSVLDLARSSAGGDAAEALRNSIDLARHVERLGYHRYWVAEHHNMPGIASSAPAVLIAHVAAATRPSASAPAA